MEKSTLEQHRIAALDLYKTITRKFEIKPSTSLTNQHTSILNNEFKVGVVGKVKAGKSTFINAILGEPLMPSDTREATCAIVEIFKSDTKYVSATFLDGHEDKVEDDLSTQDIDESHEFLKKVAAVQEKYRGLPIAQLNEFLVKNFNETQKEAVFPESEIDEWIKDGKPANIHHLPAEEFSQKIKEYLHEHKNGYHIPLTIKVGFPHNFKFDQFRIIDTPGIESTSGLGEKTKAYIEHVDAVIYLHKESPTEQSLQNAWNNVISERAKKNTFLVLTHRGSKTAADCDALFEETQKTFPHISPNRIFTVDSLTELALSEFYGKDFDAIEAICDANEAYENLCAKALRKSKGNRAELIDILERQSNMNGLKKELQKFSEKALSIQLHDFISEIRSHLESYECEQRFNLEVLGKEYCDPQYFSSEIEKTKQGMETLKSDLRGKIETIKDKFNLSDVRGEKALAFTKICADFEAEINGKGFASSDTRSDIESYVEKINKDYENKVEDFIEKLKSEVAQEINVQTAMLDVEYNITVPKVILSEIWEGATNKATGIKQENINRKGIYRVLDLVPLVKKLTKDVRYLDMEKYVTEVKSGIINGLISAKTQTATNVDLFLSSAAKRYTKMVDKQLEDRKRFLDDIKKDESSNEQKKTHIDNLRTRILEAQNGINECVKCEGELTC